MCTSALVDITLLVVVFWAVWSLRFFGVGQIGTLSMIATGGVGLTIMRRRGVTLADVGLKRPKAHDLSRTLQAAGIVGVVYFSTPILIHFFGPLTPGAAITEQPQTLPAFLLDIAVFVWLGAALGEEFAFRGIILHRFQTLFGGGGAAGFFAAAAQGIWFGLGHAGQGPAGMVMTGLMGFGLGLFFLWGCERSLVPLIIAHGLISTGVLTAAFLARSY